MIIVWLNELNGIGVGMKVSDKREWGMMKDAIISIDEVRIVVE